MVGRDDLCPVPTCQPPLVRGRAAGPEPAPLPCARSRVDLLLPTPDGPGLVSRPPALRALFHEHQWSGTLLIPSVPHVSTSYKPGGIW